MAGESLEEVGYVVCSPWKVHVKLSGRGQAPKGVEYFSTFLLLRPEVMPVNYCDLVACKYDHLPSLSPRGKGALLTD